jgi:hypothetical protein
MKGAVCLDCGYVATMVDLKDLHTPVRRPPDAGAALSREAARASRGSRSAEEEAAEALDKMQIPEEAVRSAQSFIDAADGDETIEEAIPVAEIEEVPDAQSAPPAEAPVSRRRPLVPPPGRQPRPTQRPASRPPGEALDPGPCPE